MMFRRRSRLEESRLHDYLAGDLDAAGRLEVEQLLESNPQARALLEEVRAARDALLTLRERRAPPVDLPAIQAAIGAQLFQARPKLPLEGEGTRFYRRLAMAATLLCAVTVGMLVSGGGDDAAPQPPPVLDRQPLPERNLTPFIKGDPMNGWEYLRKLEELGLTEVRFDPSDEVTPIASGAVPR